MKSSAVQLPFIEVCITEELIKNRLCYKVLVYKKNLLDGVDEIPELEINELQSIAEAEEYILELQKNYKVAHLRCAEAFRKNAW